MRQNNGVCGRAGATVFGWCFLSSMIAELALNFGGDARELGPDAPAFVWPPRMLPHHDTRVKDTHGVGVSSIHTGRLPAACWDNAGAVN
jgi:hypothetical protein